MNNINFVNAQDISSLEEYGASLVMAAFSLKTLELYQTTAFSKGLLDEDEQETSKTICWEVHRLLALYQQQVNHIMDRTNFDQEAVLQVLRSRAPDIKIPRKKKTKVKKDGGA